MLNEKYYKNVIAEGYFNFKSGILMEANEGYRLLADGQNELEGIEDICSQLGYLNTKDVEDLRDFIFNINRRKKQAKETLRKGYKLIKEAEYKKNQEKKLNALYQEYIEISQGLIEKAQLLLKYSESKYLSASRKRELFEKAHLIMKEQSKYLAEFCLSEKLVSDYDLLHRTYHYTDAISNRNEEGKFANSAVHFYKGTNEDDDSGVTEKLIHIYEDVNVLAATQKKIIVRLNDDVSNKEKSNDEKPIGSDSANITENLMNEEEILEFLRMYACGLPECEKRILDLKHIIQSQIDKTQDFFNEELMVPLKTLDEIINEINSEKELINQVINQLALKYDDHHSYISNV